MRFHLISLVGFRARFISSRLHYQGTHPFQVEGREKVRPRHVIRIFLLFLFFGMKDGERRKGGIKMKGYMGHTQKVHGFEKHSGLVFDFCFLMCVLNGSVIRRRWMYA
jgi:hypothetical protein